ncbi:MAG: hypothetical protein ABW318_13005 [Vicinamibacterales bacterium]
MVDRPLAETQLDEAIDRAVREMMNVEPRGDLRARVLTELGGPPARVSLWPGLAFATVALVAAIAVLTTTVRRPSDHPHVPRVATSQPSTTPAREPVLPTTPPSNDVASSAPRTGTTASKGRDSRHSNTGPAGRVPAIANRVIQAASIDTIDATHEPLRAIDSIGVANLKPISQSEIVITPITVEQIPITPMSARR